MEPKRGIAEPVAATASPASVVNTHCTLGKTEASKRETGDASDPEEESDCSEEGADRCFRANHERDAAQERAGRRGDRSAEYPRRGCSMRPVPCLVRRLCRFGVDPQPPVATEASQPDENDDQPGQDGDDAEPDAAG